jgi:hypothetical protein
MCHYTVVLEKCCVLMALHAVGIQCVEGIQSDIVSNTRQVALDGGWLD